MIASSDTERLARIEEILEQLSRVAIEQGNLLQQILRTAPTPPDSAAEQEAPSAPAERAAPAPRLTMEDLESISKQDVKQRGGLVIYGAPAMLGQEISCIKAPRPKEQAPRFSDDPIGALLYDLMSGPQLIRRARMEEREFPCGRRLGVTFPNLKPGWYQLAWYKEPERFVYVYPGQIIEVQYE